jgi:hypothetical protein
LNPDLRTGFGIYKSRGIGITLSTRNDNAFSFISQLNSSPMILLVSAASCAPYAISVIAEGALPPTGGCHCEDDEDEIGDFKVRNDSRGDDTRRRRRNGERGREGGGAVTTL